MREALLPLAMRYARCHTRSLCCYDTRSIRQWHMRQRDGADATMLYFAPCFITLRRRMMLRLMPPIRRHMPSRYNIFAADIRYACCRYDAFCAASHEMMPMMPTP